MTTENLYHLSSKELKDLLDNELKSKTPDYTKVSLIGEILSARDNASGAQPNSSNNSIQQTTVFTPQTQIQPSAPKIGFFKSLMGTLSANRFKLFTLICFLGSFYVGSWFFRLTYIEGSMYDANLFSRISFGFFALITVATYLIYFLLRINYRYSENFSSNNSNKILLLLGASTLMDLNLLLLDITYWIKSTNDTLLMLLLIASLLLKLYAYSRFFSTNNDDNLFIKRFSGAIARLADYQFIVYIVSGILMIILSISAFLVAMYDIDSEKFLFGFLMPFTLTLVASFFTLSYFNLNGKIWDKLSISIKILFPILTIVSSIIIIPVAIVFFLIHAFFAFEKIFKIEAFNNPTFALSQIYISVMVANLLAYFIIKVLKPFTISALFNKILKGTIVFHLAYALIGVIFAFIGMAIRVDYVGLTNNRILVLIGLLIEFVFIIFALFKLLTLSSRKLSFTEDQGKYNSVFKFMYLIPVIFLVLNWLVVGLVNYDSRRVQNILQNSKNINDFRRSYSYYSEDDRQGNKYNGEYLIDVIRKDMQDDYSDKNRDFEIKTINKYLDKSSTNLAQTFVAINFGRYGEIEKYNFNNDIKSFFEKYKDLQSTRECSKDFYQLIAVENSDRLYLNQTVKTWSVGSFFYDYPDYEASFKESNFWKSCFDYYTTR